MGFFLEMKQNGLSIFEKIQKLVNHATLSKNGTFRVGIVTSQFWDVTER